MVFGLGLRLGLGLGLGLRGLGLGCSAQRIAVAGGAIDREARLLAHGRHEAARLVLAQVHLVGEVQAGGSVLDYTHLVRGRVKE